jgi:hypothetical protein
MGNARSHCDRRSILGRVLESNECRLDALDRQGIPVVVDGPTVLEFLFDRALASGTARELRLNWMLNIAGLLNQVETEAYQANLARTERTGRGSSTAHRLSTSA